MPNIDTGLFINTPTVVDRASATQARRALTALLTYGGNGAPKQGVIATSGSPLGVSQNSSSTLLFGIAPGYAVLVRSASPTLGGYLAGSTTTVQVTLAAANASNPRIDVVYIVQPDPEAGDSGHARIDVLTGTAAASPTVPTGLPAGAMSLAQIRVPAGATAASACTVTDTRTWTSSANGLPIYSTIGDLPANPTPGSKCIITGSISGLPGTTVYVSNSLITLRANFAGAWRPWESDWQNFIPDVQGFSGGYSQLNGYLSACRWRYVAGMIRVEFMVLYQNTSPNTGDVAILLPAGMDTQAGYGGTPYNSSFQFGTAWYYDASANQNYPLQIVQVGTNYYKLYWPNPGANNQMQVIGNNTQPTNREQSDQIYGFFEYAPSGS